MLSGHLWEKKTKEYVKFLATAPPPGPLVTRELLKQYLTENKLVIDRVVAYGRWLCLRSVVTMRELTVMGSWKFFRGMTQLFRGKPIFYGSLQG